MMSRDYEFELVSELDADLFEFDDVPDDTIILESADKKMTMLRELEC